MLGSGNVATHLAKALKNSGHNIVQVWSRSLENSRILGEKLETGFTNDITRISSAADLYMLAVSDDAIEGLISAFPHRDKLLVHTSGSTSIAIEGLSGVFYPVQTFSKQKEVDFSAIPIVVEGINTEVTEILSDLANSLSRTVVNLNSEQRKVLHLAAVFACNFGNHLCAIADDILKRSNMSMDLIKPLIAETTDKLLHHPPVSVQTGPAVRNDRVTMNKHLQLLENNAEVRDLYERLSQSIINLHQKA